MTTMAYASRISGLIQEPESAIGTEWPGAGNALTILLADDNLDSMEMMAFLLDDSGHTTITTHQSERVLALALQHRPDVVILDIGLPGLNGYEVAGQLRAQPELAGIRLVAHTGYGSPENRQKAKSAGFDAYLVKPADIDALMAALVAPAIPGPAKA